MLSFELVSLQLAHLCHSFLGNHQAAARQQPQLCGVCVFNDQMGRTAGSVDGSFLHVKSLKRAIRSCAHLQFKTLPGLCEMNVRMTTSVQGYMRSGFARAALNAAQYVRLASEGRKWFQVLHLGQRGRSACFPFSACEKAKPLQTLTLSSISCNL